MGFSRLFEVTSERYQMEKPSRAVSSPAAALAVLLIRGYQRFISPLLGAHCRFYPSCSQYALMVFQEWGFFRGAWLTLRRLLKCGPWHEGGFDPPPGCGSGKNGFEDQ